MGAGRYQTQVSTTDITGGVLAAPTETIMVTTPPFELPVDGQSVLVFGSYGLTIGAGVTAITLRVRRGTGITGAIIGTGGAAVSVTAGNVVVLSYIFVDVPGIVAGQQYTLTGIATGGAASSITIGPVALVALAL